MTVTLAANITAGQHQITLSAPIGAVPGALFRLGEEMVEFLGYQVPRNPRLLDQSLVRLERGVGGTTRAGHDSGVSLLGVADAFVAGADSTEPSPFSEAMTGQRWEPLTNGATGTLPDPFADPGGASAADVAAALNTLLASTQLVFANGDVVMVEVS